MKVFKTKEKGLNMLKSTPSNWRGKSFPISISYRI